MPDPRYYFVVIRDDDGEADLSYDEVARMPHLDLEAGLSFIALCNDATDAGITAESDRSDRKVIRG